MVWHRSAAGGSPRAPEPSNVSAARPGLTRRTTSWDRPLIARSARPDTHAETAVRRAAPRAHGVMQDQWDASTPVRLASSATVLSASCVAATATTTGLRSIWAICECGSPHPNGGVSGRWSDARCHSLRHDLPHRHATHGLRGCVGPCSGTEARSAPACRRSRRSVHGFVAQRLLSQSRPPFCAHPARTEPGMPKADSDVLLPVQ